MTGHFFHADDAFSRGYVGQSGAFDNVANGVDTGNVGAVKIVDQHLALFGGHADLIQTDALDVGAHTHRRQHNIAFYRLLAVGGTDAHGALVAGGIDGRHL